MTSGSRPGMRPLAAAASMRSLQKLHLVATEMREGSKRIASEAIGWSP